jgi:N-acetylglucosamine kinase-like BadF-type ATPase
MRHFIAVDGGNSKTDVLVGTEDGEVLSFVRGATSSPDNIGVDGSLGVLSGLMNEALTNAGVQADQAVAYLAGVDLPSEVDAYRKAADQAGWPSDYVVENDLFALLRAGTNDPDAVAVICGAGINCLGRRADGRVARFPALGPVSGDWGGGHHLAALALWHAARGEDTRGPATSLTEAVTSHFRRTSVEEISCALHLGEIHWARVDELAPIVFDAADAGDAVAARLVAKQAREIISMARIAGERLELSGAAHTIVLGGGVLAARRPLLHNAVIRGLEAVAPLARVEIVQDRPVAGAALLALDRWGPVSDKVEDRIRSAVRTADARLRSS